MAYPYVFEFPTISLETESETIYMIDDVGDIDFWQIKIEVTSMSPLVEDDKAKLSKRIISESPLIDFSLTIEVNDAQGDGLIKWSNLQSNTQWRKSDLCHDAGYEVTQILNLPTNASQINGYEFKIRIENVSGSKDDTLKVIGLGYPRAEH
ncbi:hypothetical protein [Cerasicoccus fimbriatus]|uniref:hypothetical protein n=1 Tax=Cerasicoccus fimbriatus TaxID=3014554 RepID=UPI0022B3FC47|nr:hypothetical protein [Cerasicoccus sp. TK19100]